MFYTCPVPYLSFSLCPRKVFQIAQNLLNVVIGTPLHIFFFNVVHKRFTAYQIIHSLHLAFLLRNTDNTYTLLIHLSRTLNISTRLADVSSPLRLLPNVPSCALAVRMAMPPMLCKIHPYKPNLGVSIDRISRTAY